MITKRQFLLASAGGIVGMSFAIARSSAQTRSPTPQEVYFDPGNPVLGNPKGDVTIAEFFDFQCPYCKRDFPTVRDVVRKDGKVRLVMKDWPIFGPVSVYASHLTLGAAKIGKYDKTFSALMATKAKLTHDQVESVLKNAGLNVGELNDAYKSHADEIDQTLARDNALAEAFSFPGTPSYVIGHAIYGGVLDRDALTAAITRARTPA